jgi:hypothetical protein
LENGSDLSRGLEYPPIWTQSDDRLDVLRFLDEFRFWHSLDDKRLCQRCHEEITGWQLLVLDPKDGRNGMRLQCPTPDCPSTPSEWIYSDPVRAATFKSDPRPRLTLSEKEPLVRTRVHDGRPKARKKKNKKPRRVSTGGATGQSLRGAIAQLPLLRSLASKLHGIRPVP